MTVVAASDARSRAARRKAETRDRLLRAAAAVFGAPDPKAGACGSLYNICADPRLNHEVDVRSDVMADESAALLEAFFGARRGR